MTHHRKRCWGHIAQVVARSAVIIVHPPVINYSLLIYAPHVENIAITDCPEHVRLLVAFANGDSNAYGQPAVQYGTAEKKHYPGRQWHCVFSLRLIRSWRALPQYVP